MVWKHLKKPAILVASLALAVGIAPMVAFADEPTSEGADGGDQGAPELTAQAEVQSDISITVKQPAVGDTLSENATDAVSLAGGDCSIAYAVWQEAELDPVEVVAGVQYTIDLGLRAAEGSTFKADASGQYVGTVKTDKGQVDRVVVSSANPSFMEVFIKIAAASGDELTGDSDEPAADEPAATDPESTEPAATEPAPAATEAETTTTETAANTDAAATTTTSNTTASTLPKTADALPVALFGAMALMSALVLAAAWRFRRN